MPWRTNLDGRPARHGFSRTDAMIVVVVVGFIIMLVLLVSNGFNRHQSGGRRMSCRNNLKQIGLAILNYEQANKVFPPGTICTTGPIQPGNQYDVWAEAGETGEGPQGTSFLLRIMPYMEGDSLYRTWNFKYGISSDEVSSGGYTNAVIAQTDVAGFYCPTRRSEIRPGTDDAMLLHPSWTGGGTDYGRLRRPARRFHDQHRIQPLRRIDILFAELLSQSVHRHNRHRRVQALGRFLAG